MIREWRYCAIHGNTATPCRCAPADQPTTRADGFKAIGLLAALLLSIALVSAISVWNPS